MVLVRQRPGDGTIVFCTIEDETGIANIVVWPSMLQRFRRAILASSLMLVRGRLQHSPEGIIHVIAEHLEDRSAMMSRVNGEQRQSETSLRSPSHPRQERIIPRSRDFH